MDGLIEYIPRFDVLAGFAFATGVTWFLLKMLRSMMLSAKNTLDNHLEHNTQAILELRDAVQEVVYMMKEPRGRRDSSDD